MAEDIKKVLLIGDYGRNDLAFYEVKQKLYELAAAKNQHIEIDIVSADAFNTAETAALVAMAAESGKYDVIYHNTAPRKDQSKERANNAGEFLAHMNYYHQGKKTQVIGVFAGNGNTLNTFALLDKNNSDDLHKVDCPDEGSQFRSRDVFTPSVIDAVSGEVKLKEVVEIPAPGIDSLQIAALRAEAFERLKEPQLARHGDILKGYETIIGAGENIKGYLDTIHGPDEIDAIPLKSAGEYAWVEAGFVATQLALNSQSPANRLVYALTGGDQALNGALYYAGLANGASIATDDLRTLYFARAHITGVVKNKKRLEVSPISAAEKAQIEAVQLPAAITPAYIDGYGNIKLAIRHKELLQQLNAEPAVGERVTVAVRVNGKEVDALVAGGSFHVEDGKTALSSGSSGWKPPGGSEKQFLAEVFTRGGNAAAKLDHPKPGDHISITVKKREAGVPPGTVLGSGERDYTIPYPARDTAQLR